MINERIQELAEQASVIRKTLAGVERITFDKEKFAELIIRECLGIIDEEGSHEIGSIRSMIAIKQHFGFEE